MDRRGSWKRYELPGIYHITIKAAETLRQPFGKVVGNIDIPDGDAVAVPLQAYRRRHHGHGM
jgi:hypothetical protein